MTDTHVKVKLGKSGKGRLAGKKVIITGASRGMGRAIAERYADEGADLFLTATGLRQLCDTKAAAEARGARVELFAGDLADRETVGAMFRHALSAYPDLNLVVNNAGIYKPNRFIDYSADDFDRIMKINTYSVFYIMQLAIRHFLEIGGGKIVNIASTAGKWESENQSAYNASKHAVVALTRCAALETASQGINVNTICPGLVDTDMLDQLQFHAEANGISLKEFKVAAEQQVPIGRLIQPVEVAEIAVYLGATESDGMTGQSITISGGMRMG